MEFCVTREVGTLDILHNYLHRQMGPLINQEIQSHNHATML